MEKNKNEIIGKYLIENSLVLQEDIILEYATDLVNGISVNHDFYKNERFLFVRGIPSIKMINKTLIVPLNKTKYNINFISSIFDEYTKKCIKKVEKDCSFNIALIEENEKKYERKKLKLVKYQEELNAKGVIGTLIEEKINDKKLLLLTNRR
ncbi:MAG: hypothetical protein IJ568_01040 [Bacilli bacterium]|nr:hypothetical protein [Bacilli bacterium]